MIKCVPQGTKMVKGVTLVLPKTGLSTAAGSKVFINDVEIQDVTSFEIKPMTVDSILSLTITLPLEEIRYTLPE